MTKQRISTDGAPAALGPYSQAIEANGFVFCAGQLGLDPATGQIGDGIAAQTQRALRNLTAVLDAAGLTLADVVKTTCFLSEIAMFAAFNEAYTAFFTDAPPARSTFAVKDLPRGALVEIEAIAARSSV
jgi:2-iminobutanoate/2-iminopropanoate deaminase